MGVEITKGVEKCIMKSRIISRNIKTLLYKTLIRPVLTYGAETWVLSKQDEHHLRIFEHKIQRRIYGPVTDGGRWRIRTNQELCQLWVRMTLWNSASWVDWDRQDMSYSRMTMIYPGECFLVSQEESAPEGDPGCLGKMEWREDTAKLGCRNWTVVAVNREGWRKLLKEAEVHPGL